MKYNSIEKYENVWELFQSSAKKYPTNDTLEFYRKYAKTILTYDELYIQVKKLASYLHNNGYKKGDKLFIFVPTKAEWLIIYFAASLLGIILVPIDIESTANTVKQIIDETKPKGIFLSNEKDFPVSYEFHNKFYIESIAEYINNIVPITPRDFAKEIEPDDIFEIMYTSGTTGKPKGVIITHKNITTNLYNALLVFPIDIRYSALQILPFSHIFAQILAVGIISIGGKLTFVKKVNAAEIKETLNSAYINAIPAVPQFLTLIKNGVEAKFRKVKMLWLLNSLQSIATKIKSTKVKKLMFGFIHKQLGGNLELILSGGAPLDPKTFIWWRNIGVRVIKGYGLTETGPIISLEDKNNPDPYSVGTPIPYQMVKIEDGEILVKGDHVTQGYYKNPEKNKEAFTKDGWYKTGDLAEIREGKIFLSGRAKDRIILSNGVNIYPQDIEFEFNRIDKITDTCVIGIDRGQGEELFAIFLTQLSQSKIESILKKVNKKLSVNQWIKEFIIWPEIDFPRTHTKKVKRNEIKELAIELLKNGQKKLEKKKNETINNSDSINSQIKSIVASITNTEIEIKNETNLVIDLNLDSLGRAEIVSEIASKMGKRIDETQITPDTKVIDLIELYHNADIEVSTNKFSGVSMWPNHPLIRIYRNFYLYPLLRIILFPFIKVKVNGEFPKESRQLLIISNHRSNLDGLVLSMALPRRIRNKMYLAASALVWEDFPKNVLRPLARTLAPFYLINQSNTSETFAHTAIFINSGYSIGIYPEGKIMHEKKDYNKFQKGAAKIIKEFMVPVIEIKVKGLNVVPKGKLLPSIGRHPIEIDIVTKEIDYFKSIDEITEELSKDFEGY